MDDYKVDKKVTENRRESLGSETQGGKEAIQEPLINQIPSKLRNKLIDMDMPEKLIETWNHGNSLRAEELQKQRKILQQLDQFMDPIYSSPHAWQSNLHMPIAFTICKTFHARMYQATLGQDPAFVVKAEKEANTSNQQLVEDATNYTLNKWANNYSGIDEDWDDFIWHWCTNGRGIMKMRWARQFTRFVDVEVRNVQGAGRLDEEGNFVPNVVQEETPVKKDIPIFDGPMYEHVPNEDVLIIGGNGDPDKADYVGHQIYMTADELWQLADRKIFDKAAVEAVIEAGEDRKSAEQVNNIKSDRASYSGEGGSVDNQDIIDRYQIIEIYTKIPVDSSGIESDVVCWVHKETKELLRATYLWRVMKTGMKPFAVSDFHRRKGQSSGVGLVEITYSLCTELDAMHNMKIDFGLLSSMPIGFYRATSSMEKQRIPLEPGQLIPLDDPSRDINFPQMGNRSAFANQEEAALFNVIQRVTGINDLTLGILGSQGAARTATGARAVVSESNANLDIFLRRLNRAFKKILKYTYQMLVEKMPEGMEFRIEGTDGNQYFRKIQSRQELMGMFDFEVEPNSANSNKSIQINQAQQVLQLTTNPLALQLGIVTPFNLFESMKNLLQLAGVKDWSRFLTRPDQFSRVYTAEEVANRVLAGFDVPLDPRQDLDGIIKYIQEFLSDDQLLGQFEEDQIIALARKQQEAGQLMQAMQQAQAQQANLQQMQLNASQSEEQAPLQTNGGGQQ